MSTHKKPQCFQDPEVFEEDHPDCMECDFYHTCKVLVKRKVQAANKVAKSRKKSSGRSTTKSNKLGKIQFEEAKTVDVPGMPFIDRLLWNTVRQTVDTSIGELHRAWNESVPRIKYTNILQKFEPSKVLEIKNDEAEETSSED